jgi:hypothetical protein
MIVFFCSSNDYSFTVVLSPDDNLDNVPGLILGFVKKSIFLTKYCFSTTKNEEPCSVMCQAQIIFHAHSFSSIFSRMFLVLLKQMRH